jgi:bifunctional UDP-N-acetylglucosamine pyrophosphorylase/glucosamine-1-phosphate N-acetyltransferase
MSSRPLAAVILAAGKGTRMKSVLPKVLHLVAGRPLIGHVLAALEPLQPAAEIVVVGRGMDALAEAVSPRRVVVQDPQLGTGHAVLAARGAIGEFPGDVLILYADTPLVTTATLRRLAAALHDRGEAAVAVLGFRPHDPGEYGRLVVDPTTDELLAIVEARDAPPEVRALTLCNAGAMAVAGPQLFELLGGLGNENTKREYYLTDIVAAARARGLAATVVEVEDEDEVLGVNSPAELAAAEAALQRRLRRRWMEEGVTLLDPDSVFLSVDTVLAPDVSIGPYVVFGPGVTVGEGARIHAFCHIAGATIARGASVGPFARLRPGARLGEGAHIGNFVEVKNTVLGAGAKANHLTYLGDAVVGDDANIGAGTITCNYDGFEKHETRIGAGAFIGSNTSLVAPVEIGEGAVVGAGSVITEDVSADALAVARGRQEERAGWARRRRARGSGAANPAKPRPKR